jgi:hypothetical protein
MAQSPVYGSLIYKLYDVIVENELDEAGVRELRQQLTKL